MQSFPGPAEVLWPLVPRPPGSAEASCDVATNTGSATRGLSLPRAEPPPSKGRLTKRVFENPNSKPLKHAWSIKMRRRTLGGKRRVSPQADCGPHSCTRLPRAGDIASSEQNLHVVILKTTIDI